MSNLLNLSQEAMGMLLETSRTFFIPITCLDPGLQEAVTSAYLAMRAIDEIEDHPELTPEVKIKLLHSISTLLKSCYKTDDLKELFQPYQSLLPEVTLRLDDWLQLSPVSILPSILQSTATMSQGMAEWVSKKWDIKDKHDLNDYTYYVAGLVGLLLSDLWEWYAQIKTDRDLAVGFGRGLQAVNIVRNRAEDLARGVDFFPEGWGMEEMFSYAEHNLALAEEYCLTIKHSSIIKFCRIPLALAHGTLEALQAGEEKLSRRAVHEIVEKIKQ